MSVKLRIFFSNTSKPLLILWLLIFGLNSPLIIFKVKELFTLTWPITEGTVISSSPSQSMRFTREFDDLLGKYEIYISVSYKVDREYQTQYSPGATLLPAKAREYLEKYAAGTKVRVRYNPSNPEDIRIAIPSLHIFYIEIAVGWLALIWIVFYMIVNHINIENTKRETEDMKRE